MHGAMRNLAALQARTAVRRKRREAVSDVPAATDSAAAAPSDSRLRALLRTLPPAARRTALLALHGLGAAEIRWILRVGDAAFRQRLTSIRKAIAAAGGADWALPAHGPARSVALEFGLVRRALKVALDAGDGLGTHDADGHLLVLRIGAHTRVPVGNGMDI